MAMKQKSERARTARGRQTGQQKTKQEPLIRSTWESRDRIVLDTGYDTVDKRTLRDTQLDLEGSTLQLARYVHELDTESDRLKELNLGVIKASQDGSRNTGDNFHSDKSQETTDTPHHSQTSHSFHGNESPPLTSQRHFSALNTLSPPVHSSQTRRSILTEQQVPPLQLTDNAPPSAHVTTPTVPAPIDTNLNAFFQWQIQKDREDRLERDRQSLRREQERDREIQRQDSRWRDILSQQQAIQKETKNNAIIASIRPMKDDVDIAQYIEQLEHTLHENKVDQSKWKRIIISKLNTKAEQRCKTFLNDPNSSYDELKTALLRIIGPTLNELSNYIHGVVAPPFKGQPATDRLQTQIQHIERLLSGADDPVLRLSTAYFKAHCERKYAHEVRIDKISTFNDLYSIAASIDSEVAQDKARAQPLTRRKDHSVTCFFCGKQGHIESECFKKKNSITREQMTRKDNTHKDYKPRYNSDKPTTTSNNYSYKYSGRQQDHNGTGIKTRPYVVNWGATNYSNCVVPGKVNEHDVELMIDTGAQITIVPGIYVYTDNLTGDSIPILGINGDPVDYQLATVSITIKGKTAIEKVAVAPANQLNARVLLAVPLDTQKADNLLETWIQKSTAPTKEDIQAKQQSHIMVARILPARAAKQNVVYHKETSDESDTERFEDDYASDISVEEFTDETDTDTSVTSDSPQTTDTPQSHDILEDAIPPPNIVTPQTVVSQDSHTNNNYISSTENQSSDNVNSVTTVTTTQETNKHPNMDIPQGVAITPDTSQSLPSLPLDIDKSSLAQFKNHLKSDQTLHAIRGLTHNDKNGYYWQDGLVFHDVLDETHGKRKRLVVPQPYRQNIISTAHDKTGHFSKSRTCSYINTRFTWPHLTSNVTDHIMACTKCKMFNN